MKKTFITLAVIIILAIFAYGQYISTQADKALSTANPTAPVVDDQKQKELDAIQREESFKARMRNQAEQVLVQRNIDAINTQINELTTTRDNKQKELESLRTASLSL